MALPTAWSERRLKQESRIDSLQKTIVELVKRVKELEWQLDQTNEGLEILDQSVTTLQRDVERVKELEKK